MKMTGTKVKTYRLASGRRSSDAGFTLERHIPLAQDMATRLKMHRSKVTLREEVSIWLVLLLPFGGAFPEYVMRIRMQKRFWGLRMSMAQWLVRKMDGFRYEGRPILWLEVYLHRKLMK
jgi:hypothetical protein